MTNKPLVIHLIRSLNPGGCELMLLRTLPRLQKFNHYILTLGSAGSLSQKFKDRGIKILNPNSLLDLIKQIKLLKPKLIITYLFHADLVGSLLIKPLTGFKIIPFLRSTYNSFRYIPAVLSAWLTKPLIHEYLANSEAVKNYCVSRLHIPADKITVIPNGINFQDFKNIKTRSNTGNKLICVTNFHPNKGLSLLLAAFEEVFKTHPKVTLTLVGDGEEKNSLTYQISNYRSRTNIFFMGYRDDVIHLLNQADIFVLPTSFEGMSNAILEAMSCGLPVITSDIPENRVLIDSGKNGLLFSSGDLGDLIHKINQVLDDIPLRTLLGQAAKKSILARYSLDKIIRQWDNYLASQL